METSPRFPVDRIGNAERFASQQAGTVRFLIGGGSHLYTATASSATGSDRSR